MQGEGSFWRTGAEDWAPAEINMPLAPGDQLYGGPGANLEVQIGPNVFMRAGTDTQLGLEDQEPNFIQFRISAGHAAVDARELSAGQTIELDTPNAAFTISSNGYYRVDIGDDTTTFITRRGGQATMAPGGGEAATIGANEEVVLQGTDTPQVASYEAPAIDAWDRWNYQRTDRFLGSASARYVPRGVYGVDALDEYGRWRVTPNYGRVWVPAAVGPDWSPYSTGRWVWDPYYGWTWIDDAPWGWAPYHYGRWVHSEGAWCWAPGPIAVQPVYAPALVAFFGGEHFGVSIGIGAPAVGWVALGWGEPLLPWWGHRDFVGHPYWGGWGGPRVVNNVVINKTTVVNVTNITYQNVQVKDAVVATREDRFGRPTAEHVRIPRVDPRQIQPVRGALSVKPVQASLGPRVGQTVHPPQNVVTRPVVATRPQRDVSSALRAQGLPAQNRPIPAPRVVAAPHSAPPRLPAGGQRPAAPGAAAAPPGQRPAPPAAGPGQPAPQAAPPPPAHAPQAPRPEARPAQPAPPAAPAPAPHAPQPPRPEARPAQPAPHAAPPAAPRAPQPAPQPPRPEARPAQPAPQPAARRAEPAPRAPQPAPRAVQPAPRPAQPEAHSAPPPRAAQPAPQAAPPARRPEHPGEPQPEQQPR